MIGIGIQPSGLHYVPDVVRSQAVKIGGLLAYFKQPVLDFVGSVAVVSFERDGATVELKSVGLESGATRVNRAGNAVRIEGIQCGEPVVVCLVEQGRPARRVRFVFR